MIGVRVVPKRMRQDFTTADTDRPVTVKTPDTTQRFIPDAPAVLCLLGKLYRAEWRTDKAVECWAAALKLNPFMWEAFENLCDTGRLKSATVMIYD